jgi:hypothetical protein
MKKVIPVSGILLCLSGILCSQTDTFNIAQYKLPVMSRKQLDLNLNLNGTSGYQKNKPENMDAETNSEFELNDNLYLNYHSYKNNERLQSQHDYSFTLNPSFQRDKLGSEVTYKNKQMITSISLNSVNRLYNANQYFFEPDITFFSSINYNNQYNSGSPSTAKSNNNSIRVEVPLRVGKGRIEQVQDIRLAIYILQDLQKAGRISQMPDYAVIQDLATIISELKNERYFDYRIRKMEEIEKVDAFLQTHGLITSPDVRYFTTINDNWDYSSGPVRESGKRLSAGITPTYAYNYFYSKTIYDNANPPGILESKNHTLGLKAGIWYSVAKPVTIHWQRNWNINLSSGFSNYVLTDIVSESKSDLKHVDLNLAGNYSVGFYPNSRTDLSAVLSADITRTRDLWTGNIELKNYVTSIIPAFYLVMHYYISPQMRLNITYDINYNFTDNRHKDQDIQPDYFRYKTNGINQSLTAGFLYSFF